MIKNYTFRKIQTSELKDAVYECSWTSIQDKSFRKSLCIIMSRLQEPKQIRIFYFFILSVDTFFSVSNLFPLIKHHFIEK